MTASKFSTSSALMAIGMVCASVAMLTHNSTAAASHLVAPAAHVEANAVIELPAVVIVGKRIKAFDKVDYLQQRKLRPVTLV